MHLKNRNLSIGYHNLVDHKNPQKADFMKLDLDLWIAAPNENKNFKVDEGTEKVFLILTGQATLEYSEDTVEFKRGNLFSEKGQLLHLKSGEKVVIHTTLKTEFLIITTNNTKLKQNYLSLTSHETFFGKDIWENVARRKVRTFFDFSTRPDSNLVVGEVITYQGRWSSYLPHHHPQPELYFFKQEKDSGFALSVNGEEAYIVENNDVNAVPGGLTHPVSAAPGYPLYYCWIIKHLPNDPWIDRIEEEKHLWLKEEHPNYWKEKNES
ncbi:5-deoxy-glucuronate isomerase [Candidatus Mycoplasma pogonae]